MIHEPIYPEKPGHRGVDTSIAAADMIEPHVNRLQRKVLRGYEAAGVAGATVDEMCERLGAQRYSIQPRCTELRLLGLLADTGARRKNKSGATARVLVLARLQHPEVPANG